MKNTYAIAAIAMVAVIMGMSAFAPDAMAVKPTSAHKTLICHIQVEVLDGRIRGDVPTIFVPLVRQLRGTRF